MSRVVPSPNRTLSFNYKIGMILTSPIWLVLIVAIMGILYVCRG
jgi:hypothetical protein